VLVLAALVAIAATACRGGEDSAGTAAAAPAAATSVVETAPPPAASDGTARVAEGAATPMQPPPPAATPPARPASSSPADVLADIQSRLDRTLTDAASCTSDGECRSVAVGGKACGGPTGYRAYSANGADPKAVEDLASRERELATAEARASGRVSNCLMFADPGARCDQGRCVIGGQGPRAPSTR
jgi:hypothetical protein